METVVDPHPRPTARPGHRIARAVRFLVDDDAGYITGSVLAVNGGLDM